MSYTEFWCWKWPECQSYQLFSFSSKLVINCIWWRLPIKWLHILDLVTNFKHKKILILISVYCCNMRPFIGKRCILLSLWCIWQKHPQKYCTRIHMKMNQWHTPCKNGPLFPSKTLQYLPPQRNKYNLVWRQDCLGVLKGQFYHIPIYWLFQPD